jgi:hypothetical protein
VIGTVIYAKSKIKCKRNTETKKTPTEDAPIKERPIPHVDVTKFADFS